MRHLVLLALVALVAFPLSAHGHHGHRPRRAVVVEDSYGPYHRGYERRWDEDRWEHRGYGRRYDHDDDRVFLRPLPPPLAPPFQGRVELWLH